MKVGILTRSSAYNYGAVLQAYALKETMRILGHEGTVVDYRTPKDLKASRSLLRSGMRAVTLAQNLLILGHYSRWKRRYTRFDEFRRNHLSLSERHYCSEAELLQDPPDCDAFVAGSDQVWNPSSGLNPVYFLQFAKALGKKRIAYAPSFGVSQIPKDLREKCKQFISDIPWLSAREQRGSEIIRELTQRSSQTVVDPVVLLSLEQWKERFPLAIPSQPPYILVYTVRTRHIMNMLVKDLKKATGLPVVLVTGDNPVNRLGIAADAVMWDAGPRQFVELMMGAACVATSSFHGTAFAMVFRKPLYVVPHTTGDSRMTNLIEHAGMNECLITSDQHTLPEKPLEVDYEAAGIAIDDLRRQSLDYLRTALELSNP